MGGGRRGPLTVLVSGVGGPLGVSIMKAARRSSLRVRIVATDVDPLSVGLFRAEAAYVLPRALPDREGYMRRLEQVCVRERVDMVCFGSEDEMIAATSDPGFEARTGTVLVHNGAPLLHGFMDKWLTFELLRDRRLPVADTELAAEPDAAERFLERHGYPVVIKPRNASGSLHFYVVHDAARAGLLMQLVPDAVLQELLLPDDEEYTVGLYKSRTGRYVGQIVLRRQLKAGLTYKAEVVRDSEIESACRRIVEAFDIWGPINLQLRKTPAGVRIFEINLRFSSSAVMRAHFGFNEVELCLRDAVLGETVGQPPIRPGFALRYWDEVYLGPAALPQAPDGGHLEVERGTIVDDL